MRSQRLPRRKRFPRRSDGGVDVRSRSLSHRCFFLAVCGIDRTEKYALYRLPPVPVDEMAEAPSMAVQPDERIFRILRRRPIFHGREFFSDAHEFPSASRLTQADAGNPPNSVRSPDVPAAV